RPPSRRAKDPLLSGFFSFSGKQTKTRGGSAFTRVLQECRLIVIIVVIVSGVSAFFTDFFVEITVMVFRSGFSALATDFFVELLAMIFRGRLAAYTAGFFNCLFAVVVIVVRHVESSVFGVEW